MRVGGGRKRKTPLSGIEPNPRHDEYTHWCLTDRHCLPLTTRWHTPALHLLHYPSPKPFCSTSTCVCNISSSTTNAKHPNPSLLPLSSSNFFLPFIRPPILVSQSPTSIPFHSPLSILLLTNIPIVHPRLVFQFHPFWMLQPLPTPQPCLLSLPSPKAPSTHPLGARLCRLSFLSSLRQDRSAKLGFPKLKLVLWIFVQISVQPTSAYGQQCLGYDVSMII